MIKKFKAISLVLIGTIVISSCKTNFTITKRKVNKGFYISSNRMKSSDKDQLAVSEQEKTKVIPVERNKKELILKNEEFTQPIFVAQNANQQEIVEVNAEKAEKNEHKTNSSKNQKTTTPVLSEKVSPFKQLKHEAQSKAKKMAPASSSSEALSLLWIVILVLLILWALGLISGGWGMGGLINILLVIALILLILWLLRII